MLHRFRNSRRLALAWVLAALAWLVIAPLQVPVPAVAEAICSGGSVVSVSHAGGADEASPVHTHCDLCSGSVALLPSGSIPCAGTARATTVAMAQGVVAQRIARAGPSGPPRGPPAGIRLSS